MAWYEIPAFYTERKAEFIARNNGYVMQGYSEIFRRYLFKAKEPILYPDVNWLRKVS